MSSAARNLHASRPIPNTQYREWIALIAIVLLAAFFRFYALDSIPPGLHYDEAIDAHLALDIRNGARPIFFTQGWGREALNYYLVAFAMNWFAPAMALRATAATLGTLFVALAFLLLRELFDWRVAAIGGAWLASSFWVMIVSRLGLRDVAVEPLAAGAMLVLLIARRKSRIAWMVVGGVLLGLSQYTYQPSRAMPVLFVLWIVYLAVFHREQLARQWKGLVVFGIAVAVVAAPLAIYLLTHPGAESGRAFQAEPVQQLLRGQPIPMIEHILATLKMFTLYGDPQPLYNVPGRPALALLAGLAFYAGLIIALIRVRRQEYAFILLWLIAALAPALVTFPAPNFPRTLLAHLPVAALIAIAITAAGDASTHVAHRAPRFAVILTLAILVVGQTAWQTWNDYFHTWVNLKEARFQYNAGPAAAARYLDASSDTDPVILAGLFVDDSDPYNFEVMLKRRDLDLRWFDASSALPVPANVQTMRLVLYDFTPMDDILRTRYLAQAAELAEYGQFSAYRLGTGALRADIERPRGTVWTKVEAVSKPPVSFGDVSLLGYDLLTNPIEAGQTLVLITHWRVAAPGTPQPTAIFAHLTDWNDKLIAQDDRLGYPHHNWQAGDEFVQLHRIALPPQIEPGKYTLRLGLYFRDTGARWPVAGGDSIVLNPIDVRGAR